MTTQIQVSKDLAAVGIVVRYGGQQVLCDSYPLVDGKLTLPSTLGLAPQEAREGQILEPVTITVIGLRTVEQAQALVENCIISTPEGDDPGVVFIRSRRMTYLDERILYLPMPLRESCTGVACDIDQTCLGGICEDNFFDPETAVDYSDPLIFGNTNTCFSPALCLPVAARLAAVPVDADKCIFRFPTSDEGEPLATTPGSLNVEIVYHSMGTEILDLDDKEGFTFPDANDPLTFQLAYNLCESNYKMGKIVGVFAAPICPAKRALQPICNEDLAGIQAGDRSPLSSVSESHCTIGDPLIPSESALYVLLDRSLSMAELYEPASVEFALTVPLRNPVAASTRLALSFLPADAASCTDDSYVTPDFGFADVELVREPIAEALGDPATVLADDPMLFLDGGMIGAYKALDALVPKESARFNRKALIIVGNRDLQSHCDPDAPATLAAAAQADADKIFTYVTVLSAPADAEQFGDEPVSSATAIAAAGGTDVFNDVTEDEGALAVQEVLNDLGSCVYDPPSDVVSQSATLLVYVHPVTLERTDIERNDDCNSEDAATTVDGWGIETDGGGVRICGAPCAALRDTLTDAATTFAALGQPAPRIPIATVLPCDHPDRFKLPNPPE